MDESDIISELRLVSLLQVFDKSRMSAPPSGDDHEELGLHLQYPIADKYNQGETTAPLHGPDRVVYLYSHCIATSAKSA